MFSPLNQTFCNMTVASKLDLRLEAAKIVIQLPETTIDNFHERVHRVELLIQGDAVLPEQDGTMEELREMLGDAKDLMLESAKQKCSQMVYEKTFASEHVPVIERMETGSCLGIANPNGIPSSEGEALYLQENGEKVE